MKNTINNKFESMYTFCYQYIYTLSNVPVVM